VTDCSNEDLIYTQQNFQKRLLINKATDSTFVSVNIPVFENDNIIADSINKKVFKIAKEIVYFDDQPISSLDYNLLLTTFINSYQQFIKDFPDYHFPWEITLNGKVTYQSESIVCIEIKYYTFTGGAHGNGGFRAILCDTKTGKMIPNNALFINSKKFKSYAEKKFRLKYNIPLQKSINSTGLQFEDEKFQLPQNIFYTDKGLLLYYNQYEIASYADGPKELFLPIDEVSDYLKFK
jgi:hypothetical protein